MTQNNNKWHLLNRLKTLVKKVTFLMNSNINQWRIVSSFIESGGGSRRRTSFNERLGLTAIISSSDDEEEEVGIFKLCDSGSCSPELLKTRSFRVQRTMSFPEEDDVDKRAELFIENFYRQLRLQRQVSLQLRYKRDTSFDSSESISP